MNQSLNDGQRAEQLFKTVAHNQGWNVTPASRAHNMHKHIDFDLQVNGKTVSFDVKARKRESRQMQQQDTWHAIEFVGVAYPVTNIVHFKNETFDPLNPVFTLGSGRAGWVYGEATYIAFECDVLFAIVKREQLIHHCALHVNFSNRVKHSSEAKYKVYSRYGRGDLVTYINVQDLYHLAVAKWYKPISMKIED